MLYIDQPVGTGLSYTTGRVYPRNDAEVNYALMDFFDGLFQLEWDVLYVLLRPRHWEVIKELGLLGAIIEMSWVFLFGLLSY